MCHALVSPKRPFYYLSVEAALRHGERVEGLIEEPVQSELAGAPLCLLTCENGDKTLIGQNDGELAAEFSLRTAGRPVAMRRLFHAD